MSFDNITDFTFNYQKKHIYRELSDPFRVYHKRNCEEVYRNFFPDTFIRKAKEELR